MNKYIIVSYYTDNYEEVAKKYLLKSLKKFPDIPHYIEKIENKGSWKNNTYYKAEFIKKCMNKFKENIVWVDIDATINEYPKLFDTISLDYDIGVHYLDWKLQYGNINRKELLTGTLYIKNNEKMKIMIDNWIYLLTKYDKWEQKALEELINAYNNIKIFELPREYCYISTTPKGIPFTTIDSAIITHFQSSRNNK